MKVLIAYFSATGETEKMAGYIAEGVRFSGHQVAVKNIKDIRGDADTAGYDGYIFGAPTFSLDVPGPVKKFLSSIDKVNLKGRLGGAFGAYAHDVGYQHDAHAPAIILNMEEKEYRMKPFELGPLTLKEDVIETGEGMKACHDYGRVFGEKLGT
jgi:flavodoxin